MNINELREKVKNGDFDDNELIDLVLYLERENQALLEENTRYKEVIDKIKTRYIDYYGTTKEVNDNYVLRSVLKEISDLLKEVE